MNDGTFIVFLMFIKPNVVSLKQTFGRDSHGEMSRSVLVQNNGVMVSGRLLQKELRV